MMYSKSFLDQILATVVTIPSLLEPTLSRLGCHSIGDCLKVAKYIRNVKGIGSKKIIEFDKLVDAITRLHDETFENNELDSKNAIEQDIPLIFVPSIIKGKLEGLNVFNIKQLFDLDTWSLESESGWGVGKLRKLGSLQQFYFDLLFYTAKENDSDDDQISKRPIFYNDFSERTSKCLHQAGVRFYEQLKGIADDELLLLNQFGVSCLFEVHEKLKQLENEESAFHLDQKDWWKELLPESFLDFTICDILNYNVSTWCGSETPIRELSSFRQTLIRFSPSLIEGSESKDELLSGHLSAVLPDIVNPPLELPDEVTWYDLPLRVPIRIKKVLRRHEINTVRQIYHAVYEGGLTDLNGHLILFGDLPGVGENSLEALECELTALSTEGVNKYTFGTPSRPETINEFKAVLRHVLPQSELEIIKCLSEGYTMKSVGELVGVSESRISQLVPQIEERLAPYSKLAKRLLESEYPKLTHLIAIPKSSVESQEDLRLALFVYKRVIDKAPNLFVLWDNQKIANLTNALQIAFTKLKNPCNDYMRNLVRCLSEEVTSENAILLDCINQLEDLIHNDLGILKELGIFNWLQPFVRQQVTEASINGIFFEDLQHFGVFESDNGILDHDNLERLEDGRLRRPGVEAVNSDCAVQILLESETPLDHNEIAHNSGRTWHQPTLTTYVTERWECISTSRGKYTHVFHLGLSVEDVIKISNWGAKALYEIGGAIGAGMLLDDYQILADMPVIDSVPTLTSIIAKHPLVKRHANTYSLCHREFV